MWVHRRRRCVSHDGAAFRACCAYRREPDKRGVGGPGRRPSALANKSESSDRRSVGFQLRRVGVVNTGFSACLCDSGAQILGTASACRARVRQDLELGCAVRVLD